MHTSRSFLLSVSLFILLLWPTLGFAWSGKVVSVIDGDTIKVLHDGSEEIKGIKADSHIIPSGESRYKGKGQAVTAQPSDETARQQPDPAAEEYHGNVNSHKFHQPNCPHYNCPNCTAVFKSREEAIAEDYEPCGICKP